MSSSKEAFARRALEIANTFHKAVAALDAVTIKQIERGGNVAYKTVMKDIRGGTLPARQDRINGKLVWLVDRADADAYIASLQDRLARAKAARRGRPTATHADSGNFTVRMLATMSGRSRDFVYDCIRDGRLIANVGKTGAYQVQSKDAWRFIEMFGDDADNDYTRRYMARAKAEKKRMPKGRGRWGTIQISDPQLLVWLLLDQPECSVNRMAEEVGVSPRTMRSLRDGAAPNDDQLGRIAAFAKERFGLKLSPRLDSLAAKRRADYMRHYMAADRRRREDNER